MTLGEAALVGTARTRTEPETGTAIDALVRAVGHLTIERRLLLSAGALEIWRRAGQPPHEIRELPLPAPTDARLACSVEAAAVLRELFDVHPVLLIEAFQLLARHDRRLPSVLLVPALDLDEPELREAARPVLGERGRWLAKQRSVWSWARIDDIEATAEALRRMWEEGRIEDRLAAITHLRDRHPEMARQWIADVWTREKAEVRAELLSVLQRCLSMADEPWLSVAVKDRAAAVRTRAAGLLAVLPESELAARAAARARQLLEWTAAPDIAVPDVLTSARRGVASALIVNPPEGPDPAWEADGLSVKPPRGTGERAHWLAQVLGLVNPGLWSTWFGASPAELTRAAWRTEWGSALMLGWSRAAQLHQADDWLPVLWDSWRGAATSDDPLLATLRTDVLTMVFAAMRVDEAERRLIELLQPGSPFDIDPAVALSRFDVPWRNALGTAVVAAIERALATPNGSDVVQRHLRVFLRAAGTALPVSLFDRALELPANSMQLTPALSGEVQLFAERVHLRKRLHEEIAE